MAAEDEAGDATEHQYGLVRLDDLAVELPDSVFVLLTAEGELELRASDRGEVMAVAFSDFPTLAEFCGAGQPCARLSRADLADAAARIGIAMFALDLPIPEGHRYPEPDSREQPDMDHAETDDRDSSLVYVPSRPYRPGQEVAVLELQPHQGKRTLLVYTSEQMLRACCGPHQAFVVVPIDCVAKVAHRVGAEATVLNPVLSEDSRHTGPVLDWASEDHFS